MSRAIHHIETKKGRGEIFKKKKKWVSTNAWKRVTVVDASSGFLTCLQVWLWSCVKRWQQIPQVSSSLSSYLSRPSIYGDCIYGQQGEKTARTEKIKSFRAPMLDEESLWDVSSNWIFSSSTLLTPVEKVNRHKHQTAARNFFFFFFGGVSSFRCLQGWKENRIKLFFFLLYFTLLFKLLKLYCVYGSS